MAKRALITGITGQDGSYLAELLLDKGYEVHGIIRRASTFNTSRIEHIYADPHQNAGLRLHYGDLADASALARLIEKIQPNEIYNLAAQSHVRVSFDSPEYTTDITATGATRLLEAIRESGIKPRFYQASSSEMYGQVVEIPQRETTPFYPRSPYACAKVYAYWITVNYRESYGMFACNGILFNHESPRRGETFVTRKITRAVAHIQAGLQDKLYLGQLGRQTGLGLCQGICRSHVADAPTGSTRRLRGLRPVKPTRPRVSRRNVRLCRPRLAQACGDRRKLFPAGGGGFVNWRQYQSAAKAGLEAENHLQGPRPPHGGCRYSDGIGSSGGQRPRGQLAGYRSRGCLD